MEGGLVEETTSAKVVATKTLGDKCIGVTSTVKNILFVPFHVM